MLVDSDTSEGCGTQHSKARGNLKEMGDCKVVSEGKVARLYQMAVCRDIKKTKRVKAEART